MTPEIRHQLVFNDEDFGNSGQEDHGDPTVGRAAELATFTTSMLTL